MDKTIGKDMHLSEEQGTDTRPEPEEPVDPPLPLPCICTFTYP